MPAWECPPIRLLPQDTLLLQEVPVLSQAAVLDTVAAVFSEPEFNPPRRWWSLPSMWWWTKYLDFSLDPRTAWWLGIAMLIIAGVIALVYYFRQRLHDGDAQGATGDMLRSGLRSRDAWTTAQELAAQGDFTGAAHALYVALLANLARRELLRLHPSKTIGDYLRELRRRPAAPVQTVREFVRSYEVVAYGLRDCDADRYARLHALAVQVIQPNG